MTQMHGGNIVKLAAAAGRPAGEILDFSANINPLGPPEWLRPLISAEVSSLVHYPDPDCTELVGAFAERFGVAADEVMMGNGETELLHLLPRVLGKGRAVIPVPSYSDYAAACELAGLNLEPLPLREERGFAPACTEIEAALRGDEIVILGRPNNPTGTLIPAEDLRDLAARHPATAFAVDEAFADFTDQESLLAGERPANLIVLRSLTKFYAIPGLRLGAAVAERETIRRLRALAPPWSVNTLAQAVGAAALRDVEYADATRRFVTARRGELTAEIGAIPGLAVYPGTANFLLVRLDRGAIGAPELARRLLADGIAIRVCDNFAGLDGRFFRVAVRTAEENGRLCDSLRKALGCAGRAAPRRKPLIMFQGTGSNAGKSVLTAALCRILLQDGLRVAPFKAQNMSLNSYVTRDGGEMGRAQVVQAQACRIDPDVRMNPVLLKPNSDTGSQVIVLGKPIGNREFWEYTRDRKPPFAAAKEAFDSLAAEYDAIVMEGAGSPGEVNLKRHDIVNMNMALYAKAPVLIVGDIDRGGVFASFIGTMEVLSERERASVEGFVVNRFRGKEEFLDDRPRVRPSPHGAPRPGRRPLAPRPRPPRRGLGELQGRPDRRPRPRGRTRGDRRDRPSPHLELHRFRSPPDRAGRPAPRRPEPRGAGRTGRGDPPGEQERDRRYGGASEERDGGADPGARAHRADGDRRDLRRPPDPGDRDRRSFRDRVRHPAGALPDWGSSESGRRSPGRRPCGGSRPGTPSRAARSTATRSTMA